MPSFSAPPESTRSDKEAWRERFRDYRRSLGDSSSYATRGTLIGHHALGHPAVARASTVHVYWPLLAQGEVDTRLLVRALRGLDKTVVLPVVTSYDPETPTMEHRRYEGPSSLTPNRWDIPEPTDTPRVSPEALDVVLLPALGVDRQGNRIGQGAGYYDAFLDTVNAPRLALSYEACVVDTLPSAPHDVPVTTVVTERGWTKASAPARP
ncbi:MAG: 5-formyltetrahydrofolate cyclo-ligase [Bacteroidetes bacterium SW_9_63_38]|nr:MAG: 5-formyltetrahydrofolate cyclo-ligase [Bacteroidetes bacterium SW_9_63_38]